MPCSASGNVFSVLGIPCSSSGPKWYIGGCLFLGYRTYVFIGSKWLDPPEAVRKVHPYKVLFGEEMQYYSAAF